MSQAVPATGTRLARNTFLNLSGQALPALVALATVPYILHGLGVTRFGILSLTWVVIGYLSLFDFGLGRATVRFVADALGREDHESVPGIFWTSVSVQVVLGVAGGVLLALATPWLVSSIINAPGPLAPETRTVFLWVALALPMLVCTASLRGVLEANQRFGLVNIVRSLSGALIFLAPAVGVAVGIGLPGSVALLVGSLALTAAAYLALDLRVFPALRRFSFDRPRLRILFAFGGWVTASALVIPLLAYSDRFLLTYFASVAVLAYYTVPYDLVSRLLTIPGSFGSALFPALSQGAARSPEPATRMYLSALKYLLLVIGPVTLALVLTAGPLLAAWLGSDFARRGTLPLQILAFGMVLNSLSQMPSQLLDALGRPDLRAKIFISYLPLYLVLAAVLIARWGVVGAAAAWTLRSAIELGLFVGVSGRLLGLGPATFLRTGFASGLVAFCTFALAGAAVVAASHPAPWLQLLTAAGCVAVFCAVIWAYMLDGADRGTLRRLLAARWSAAAAARPLEQP